MKIKIIIVILLIFNISCASENPQNENEKIPLGINIDWATDWNNMPIFTSILKQARGFGYANEPWKGVGKIKLDKEGWPIEDFGIVVFTARKHLKDKVYNISFETDKFIDLKLVATKGKIFDVRFNEATKVMNAKIYIPKESDQLMLSFNNTDMGIKNLKIINELDDENEIFTKEFLEMHHGFGVLRFMELQGINGTNIKNWNDRTKLDEIFPNYNGIPWEYSIDLCNKLNADIWINIPAKATDDYVVKLAQLLKTSLNKDLKIYLEYSNEPWNLAFSQNAYLKEIGKSKGISAKNEYFIAGIEAADRLKNISDLFRGIFGSDSINTRVRPILGAQIVWPDVIESQLKYIDKTYGNPDKYFYAFAGGAYVSGKSSTVASLGEVYSLVLGNIEKSEATLKYRENMALANKYKLKFLAYEGGIDIIGLDFKVASEITKKFIQDKRMGELIKLHLDNWYKETNNSLFMWYKSGASDTWGLTDSMDNMNSEKIKVMKAIQNSLKQ